MNNRNHYFNRLMNVKPTSDIKVIAGVRKRKLMDAFIEILEKEEKANLIRMKLNSKDSEELYNYIQKNDKKKN